MSSTSRPDSRPGRRYTLPLPEGTIDPALERFRRKSEQSGYDRGYQDGLAEGQRWATEQVRELSNTLSAAVRQVSADAAELRRSQAAEIADLAAVIVHAVLSSVPADPVRTAIDRIAAALAQIDSADLTIRVHPDIVAVVTAAVGDHTEADVQGDRSLQAGDVVVSGAEAMVDLRTSTVWPIITAALADAAIDQPPAGDGDGDGDGDGGAAAAQGQPAGAGQ